MSIGCSSPLFKILAKFQFLDFNKMLYITCGFMTINHSHQAKQINFLYSCLFVALLPTSFAKVVNFFTINAHKGIFFFIYNIISNYDFYFFSYLRIIITCKQYNYIYGRKRCCSNPDDASVL